VDYELKIKDGGLERFKKYRSQAVGRRNNVVLPALNPTFSPTGTIQFVFLQPPNFQ
jgi:hypothetical protein